MVRLAGGSIPDPFDEDAVEKLRERLSKDRPSRRKKRRTYRRARQREVRIQAEHLPTTDAERMGKALVVAHREIAAAQAEAEARRSAKDAGKGAPPSEGRDRDEQA